MIWRDDDISFLTNLEEFKKVHEFFNEYNQVHTIALLTRDIHKNPALVEYIKSQPNIDVQVHSFDHIDFIHATTDEIIFQLEKSKQIIEMVFDKIPTIFYPTFNNVDERVIEIAQKLGLETSYKKISTLYYVRNYKNIDRDSVVNFHYWDYSEAILIRAALKAYTENESSNSNS